ncbi:hypothetical protein I311_05095 [Cryptococcus gattii NT-10]|nr:hypothetical protein I311_05095 [Cryptococcus gattii NT-10]
MFQRHFLQTPIRKPFTSPALDPHHPPPLLHVLLRPRQRKVQDLFRYKSSFPCDCCCAPFIWAGKSRGHRV